MKVAIATYALHVGGMETALFTIARGLRRRGFDVEFVITKAIGKWHGVPEEEGFGMRTVLPATYRTARGTVRRLASVLADFDAVVLNHCSTGQAIAGLLPERVPAMSILHNDMDEIYQVGLANSHNLDSIVCVSPKVFAEALHRGAPPERTRVIRYGVPVADHWPKAETAAATDILRVAFVGRILHVQKGVLDLPAILGAATAAGVRCCLDVVGGGEDLEGLRAAMARVCPTVETNYHGPLPHAAALHQLSMADVMLLPSRFEGLPLVLCESMARGVVPIASLLPGITDDPVKHGSNGMLCSVGDIAAFASALQELTNRATLRRMSEAAWKTVTERFNDDKMCDLYAEELHRITATRADGHDLRRSGRIDGSLLGARQYLPLLAVSTEGRLRSMVRRVAPRRST